MTTVGRVNKLAKDLEVCSGTEHINVMINEIKTNLQSRFESLLEFTDKFGSLFEVSNLKVKVKLSLCLTKHHATKAYWGSGDIAPLIL
jgi:hypothetical protein